MLLLGTHLFSVYLITYQGTELFLLYLDILKTFLMCFETEIGLGLTGFGVFFSFLGIVFVFDKGLLAMGNVSTSDIFVFYALTTILAYTYRTSVRACFFSYFSDSFHLGG